MLLKPLIIVIGMIYLVHPLILLLSFSHLYLKKSTALMMKIIKINNKIFDREKTWESFVYYKNQKSRKRGRKKGKKLLVVGYSSGIVILIEMVFLPFNLSNLLLFIITLVIVSLLLQLGGFYYGRAIQDEYLLKQKS